MQRMKHLPLFFDLRGRPVLVVGGGSVAARKAAFLHEVGAALTVIAPEIDAAICALPQVNLQKRPAGLDDLESDWHLVILATNRPDLQASLADRCRTRRIPVNRCDAPDESDFVTGSLIDRPPFLIAINSGGSPTLSRLVRKRLEQVLEPALCELAELLNELRPEIKRRIADPVAREDIFRTWGSEEALERLKREGAEALRQAILASL